MWKRERQHASAPDLFLYLRRCLYLTSTRLLSRCKKAGIEILSFFITPFSSMNLRFYYLLSRFANFISQYIPAPQAIFLLYFTLHPHRESVRTAVGLGAIAVTSVWSVSLLLPYLRPTHY